MLDQEPLKFSCSGCGRQFAWKPEIAGRRAKCKCGQTITAPVGPPRTKQPAESEAMDSPKAAAAGDNACPACAAALDDGALMCMACGYVLETGQSLQTQVEEEPIRPVRAAAAAPARAAKPAKAAPGRPRQSSGRGDHDPSHLKPVIIAGVVVVLLAGLIIGTKLHLQANRTPSKPLLGQDELAIRMLRDQSPIEARKYLDMHESYNLGVKWNKRQCKYRVDEWYRMGAKKVYAFSGIITLNVVVELNPEPEKRKELFLWTKNWDEEQLREPQTDVGQDYLIIDLGVVRPS